MKPNTSLRGTQDRCGQAQEMSWTTEEEVQKYV